MAKTKTLIISAMVYILSLVVLVFNNVYQLSTIVTDNKNLLTSLLVFLGVVLFYYIYNQNELKKLLR